MKILLFLYCIFLSLNLSAFEIKGFKGGMSYAEVITEASLKNWYLKPFYDVKGSFYIQNESDENELIISFCESNKMLEWASYSKEVKDFNFYSKIILEYQKKGFKIYDTLVSSRIGLDSIEINSMKIFMLGNYNYIVQINLYSNSYEGVTNYQVINYYKENYCD